MPWPDEYKKWFVPVRKIQTVENRTVEVLEFRHRPDEEILKLWARHFRNHYCRDDQIDALRNGTGKSRTEYLMHIKFPDPATAPGPSIRAGDFAEILVADYIEYILQYWVPRSRYADKAVRNESTKGCDIIGVKMVNLSRASRNDELVLFEAKAQLTHGTPSPRLQDAIDDSAKDELRKAESLNAIKQRMLNEGNSAQITLIERFQNFADNPYLQQFGAAAIFSTLAYCEKTIAESKIANHPYKDRLMLVVIRGEDLMPLVHNLYRRAADEA
jgi:Cap4 SAVED domain